VVRTHIILCVMLMTNITGKATAGCSLGSVGGLDFTFSDVLKVVQENIVTWEFFSRSTAGM